MYDSVAAATYQLNNQFEGNVPWMYLDDKGLVTTGIGLLIDNGSGSAPAAALNLPWKHADQSPASADEIQAAWNAVKNSGLAGIGGGNQKFANLSDLRLDAAGIRAASDAWYANAANYLVQGFPGYATMQADAQLAINLMAYALGAAFANEYPKFAAAVNAMVPDWDTAMAESNISTADNPGVAPRDAAIQQLLMNAKAAQSSNVDPSLLWWPNNTEPSGSGGGGGGTWLGRILLGVSVGILGYTAHMGYLGRKAERFTDGAIATEERYRKRLVTGVRKVVGG